MKECVDSSEMFHTYLPGVDTTMPDGTSIFYSDTQNECPACDVSNWGGRGGGGGDGILTYFQEVMNFFRCSIMLYYCQYPLSPILMYGH